MSEDTRANVAQAWPALLEGIAAGDMVKDVLARAGLTYYQVRHFLRSNPQLRTEWEDAREASADAFMDEAFRIARNPADDPAHARTLVDLCKWGARIRNPRAYSDKSTVDVNVKTVDLTQIIRDANARLIAQQQGRMIDVTPSNSGKLPGLAHAQSAVMAAALPDLF